MFLIVCLIACLLAGIDTPLVSTLLQKEERKHVNLLLYCHSHQFVNSRSVLQVGSQHRDKAEPAGAIVNGKWVAQKEGHTTLTWDKPPGPYCRDLTDPPKEAAAEAKK